MKMSGRMIRFMVLFLVLQMILISFYVPLLQSSHGVIQPTQPPPQKQVCQPQHFICPPSVLAKRNVMRHNKTLVYQQLGGSDTFHSQFWEDWFLYTEFFHGERYWGLEHTFIELGGYDGETGSNSYFFDKTLGWKGLLLEASTANYVLMEKARLSRSVVTIHGAVCQSPRMLTLWGGQSLTANNRKEANGLFHDDHESVCLCLSMTTYLEMIGKLANKTIEQIDYFSMDVEGQELEIIESHDWVRYPVFVVSLEVAVQPLLSGTETYQHEKRCALHQRGLCRWPFYDNFTPPLPVDQETKATFARNNEIWVNPALFPVEKSVMNRA